MYRKKNGLVVRKTCENQSGKDISPKGVMMLSSLVLSLVWVRSYQYRYNISAFNTDVLNIWAFGLWLLGGYLTLQLVLFARNKIRISALYMPLAWSLYFLGLLLIEYIGYYILHIREQNASPGSALVFGVVHGSFALHIYYLTFPFLISGVYLILSTISAPAIRRFNDVWNSIFQPRLAMWINMNREHLFNLPNLLSGYRLIISPFILYLIFMGRQDLFLMLLGISILTDILDGFIARKFSLQTKFGAKLDSVADIGTYIVVAYGVIQFRWHELTQGGAGLWVFLIAFILPYFVSFLRFGKIPSLHLYSSKIGGTIDTAFLIYLFCFGFEPWFFSIALAWGVFSFVEMTIVLLILKEMRSDCKGLYWLLGWNTTRSLKMTEWSTKGGIE